MDPVTDPNNPNSGTPEWITAKPSLAGDAEAVAVLGRYKSEDEAWKSSVKAHKQLSTPGHLPENLDAFKPDQRVDFTKRALKLIGLPESYMAAPAKPEDYKLAVPQGVPETLKVDQALEKTFREAMNKFHAPNDLAQELYAMQVQAIAKAHQALEQAKVDRASKATERLTTYAGSEENLNAGNTFIERLCGHTVESINAVRPGSLTMEEVKKELETGGLGDAPAVWMILNHLAQKYEKEHGTNPGQGPGQHAVQADGAAYFPNSPKLWGQG